MLTREYWLIWQSATAGAVPAVLPTEPQALVDMLELVSDRVDASGAHEALVMLIDAI
jgi:hypothetical protein